MTNSLSNFSNDDIKEIEKVFGSEFAEKLINEFGGTVLYIPKRGKKEMIKLVIKREYDGTRASAKKLARRFHYSERQIYRIVKGN